MTRGASASVIGAAVVSAVLTAAVALPMGANAIDAAADPPGLHEDIALDDSRFPAAVPLVDDQLEVLERAPEVLAGPAADEPEATATEAPSGDRADAATATPTTGDEREAEELAIIFPTPTTEAPPTPRPIPTAAPAPPTPTPLAPTPAPTTTPEPSPTPELDEPTPTEVPESTPDPTPELGDMPSTDVYAYVTGDPLVENEVGNIDVKAVNGGGEATTAVTMTVSTAGARILSVTPQRSDWTCSGGSASWSCSGPNLEAAGYSRGIMAVLPSDEANVTVSVSISHGIMDEAPGNNSLQATVPVVPDGDPGPALEDEFGDAGFPDDSGTFGGGGDGGADDGAGDGAADGDSDGAADGDGDGAADGTAGDSGVMDDAGTDGDPPDPGSDGASGPSATPGDQSVVANEPTRPTGEAESASRATD